MDIADITANQQTTINSALNPEGGSGEEFNNFLQLLTAQIQNQDPLAPLDSTQFVEQLATFSTLEQQVRSNSNLEGIAQGINELQSLVASQWLGQTVSVESSDLTFNGQPVDFGFTELADADRAVLTVRDSQNRVIWSEVLDQDQDTHQWNGQTASGVAAISGASYQISIDQFQGDDFLGSVSPRITTTVTDVSTAEDGTPQLGTDMSDNVSLAAVQRIDP
ncbi:MAG: flagellar hook capping FlgD N-terminal domain-containing protein [Hyphomonadaceae bacterium]